MPLQGLVTEKACLPIASAIAARVCHGDNCDIKREFPERIIHNKSNNGLSIGVELESIFLEQSVGDLQVQRLRRTWRDAKTIKNLIEIGIGFCQAHQLVSGKLALNFA